jgi:hypothetical protein
LGRWDLIAGLFILPDARCSSFRQPGIQKKCILRIAYQNLAGMKLFLLIGLSVFLSGCGLDYEPDCNYLTPNAFEIIRDAEGHYLIRDHSEERATHLIFPEGLKMPPVNIFEAERFDDSCSAKGFLKSELAKINKHP